MALAIIGDIVPPRERAKYQGYFLAVFGTSSVLGPVVGGFFAGQATILGITGWRWVFLVNVPIGIVALFVVNHTLNIAHHPHPHRIDWKGAVALTVGLVPLLTVAEQGRSWGWDSPWAITCYVIGLIGVVAFFLAERSMGDEALIPLRLFKDRTVSISTVVQRRAGHGPVRWRLGAAALPADRQGLVADPGRPAAAAADAGHHDRLDRVRPDHLPHRQVPGLPDHRRLADARRPAAVRAGRGGHPASGRP